MCNQKLWSLILHVIERYMLIQIFYMLRSFPFLWVEIFLFFKYVDAKSLHWSLWV